MQTYYVIVTNVCDVIELGDFNGLVEAEEHAAEQSDHLSHGHAYIVVSHSMAKKIMNELFKV